MIRALVVEDELHLRTLIKQFITEVDDEILIVAEAGNIDEAAEAVEIYAPEIVFLDIKLPGGTGFDLLDRMDNIDFEVIFITAYDKYFLDAFKHAAIGYILKPVDKDDLTIAINNAKKRIVGKSGRNKVADLLEAMKSNSQNEHDKIGVPTGEGIDFIATHDIVHCTGQKAYTKLVLRDGSEVISSYNLAHFRKLLPEDLFFQVHKSHIISLENVKRYNSKEAILEMINGDEVPVSRSAKSEFISHFKIPKR